MFQKTGFISGDAQKSAPAEETAPDIYEGLEARDLGEDVFHIVGQNTTSRQNFWFEDLEENIMSKYTATQKAAQKQPDKVVAFALENRLPGGIAAMYENHTGDTAYLQNLINSTDTALIPMTNPLTGDEIWIISSPLFLTSGKTVILDGAHLRLADGIYSNIFATEIPVGETKTADDLLHEIHIIGQNGAVLDGGIHNGLTEKTANKDGRPHVLNNTFVYLRGVSVFSVKNLRIVNPRYWGLTFVCCSDGEISDIDFTAANDAPNQDGIDLRVGCHDIVIHNITGSTGDDTVALTGLLGYTGQQQMLEGMLPDIHDVVIENIDAYVTGGHGIIRLLCHDSVNLYNVRIAHVHDRSIDCDGVRCQAAIRIGDKNYAGIRQALPEEMHDITVSDVLTNAKIAVKLHGAPKHFVMQNVRTTDGDGIQLITD